MVTHTSARDKRVGLTKSRHFGASNAPSLVRPLSCLRKKTDYNILARGTNIIVSNLGDRSLRFALPISAVGGRRFGKSRV